MKMKKYFVYILAKKNKTLYIGFTDILARRIFEHKQGLINGFTKRYNVSRLVYYETHSSLSSAVQREKQLKNWHRQWKINLIQSVNNDRTDLYSQVADPVKFLYSS